ncbi:MAG: PEP/pyruvate-binding domain-containing protein [Candidatus Nanohalobium sp.]
MVQWQGEIDRDQSGLKAARLDSINNLEVPNFFTITRDEVEQFVSGRKEPQQILSATIPSDLMQKIKDAQDEIGMSSEVRNASGRAKNLVGGQRDSQRVSIRISDEEKGLHDYELNVGTSNLEKALKSVIASYYSAGGQEYPAVIVQKMMEPGETGTAVLNFTQEYSLFEATEGLGNSLEEGITTPDIYLVNDNGVQARKIPEKQVKMSRNPMNGQDRRTTVTRDSASFKDSEVRNFIQKVRREGLSVKFVHKRGTFYIVDAFKADQVSRQKSVEGLRVSQGEIEGRAGVEVSLSDQTVGPKDFKDSLIARRGGYVSTDAQRSRAEGKPAIFSYSGELEEEQDLYIPERGAEIQEPRNNSSRRESTEGLSGSVTATEVIPLESDRVNISSPFSGYRVKGLELASEEILQSYRDVMEFSSDRFVLDTRGMEGEGVPNSLDYLEADHSYLVVKGPDRELLGQAVRQNVSVIAPEEYVPRIEQVLAEEEKKLILDHVRSD